MPDTVLLKEPAPQLTDSPNLSSTEQELIPVSGGDAVILAESSDYIYYLNELLVSEQYRQEQLELILISQQRQEAQFEGILSILLIIIVVGLLNFIYKFFK